MLQTDVIVPENDEDIDFLAMEQWFVMLKDRGTN